MATAAVNLIIVHSFASIEFIVAQDFLGAAAAQLLTKLH
jgi:hypothetical protein